MAHAERFGPEGWAVRVTAPARLSFTLINLDGESLRRNGIAAMSVRDPHLVARVAAVPGDGAGTGGVEVVGTEEETAVELAGKLAQLRELWDGPAVRVDVERPLPQHSGFGSKTTSLLAIGHAYGIVCGQDVPLRELSRLLGRGRTSGASTGLAATGGFLVDGGHRNPPEFFAAPQEFLRPSRFATPVAPPEPVVRLPFPPWPILVLLTGGRHLGGTEELEWFKSVTPIPHAEAARTAQLVFLGLAPAVAEADYDGFCAAVDAITFGSHFKREQVKVAGSAVGDVLDAGRAEPSIDAIALSVTGPSCFAFTRDPGAATRWAQGLRERGAIRDFWFTTADNTGLSAGFAP
ncbi:beta-ribofuranosylaminobenzene 5'-phosphate synthase family protein [Actinokineospora bangkokensis]|uniref:Beta-ribofuranosylaminobenzene 5'-phosphate synthase n=1 Tax=Actinokineospora bangkokensis TaxID=1193682 RepID=A0A1Q9LJP0_9PSEU|nr:beta-ribofuranosylaminobenzene 5'-phosphate synthase family protein [Actinokineospora bangkokensis]OLR92230.1 beta-ribofuranosylaminobenzene 5'-phosphate synthase [Actinokineospora bangkokensis]